MAKKKTEKKAKTKTEKKSKTKKVAPWVLLNGSPRRKGNTAAVISAVETEAKAAGIPIKRYDLWKMKYRGCAHCDSCMKKTDRPGCKLKDDLSKVLKAIHKAPGVMLASPVYCWAVSGSLSTALDRFYCFFKAQGSLLQGKKLAALYTAGGAPEDGADLCIAMSERLGQFGGMDNRGNLVLANCGTPRETAKRDDLKEQAATLIKNL